VASTSISVSAEVIVSDFFGNVVGLPLTGGNATGGYTIANSGVTTSPYYLYIYIDDEQITACPAGVSPPCPSQESFYFDSSNFGAGTLTSSSYTPTTPDPSNLNCQGPPPNPCVTGTPVSGAPPSHYLGSANTPNTKVGLYTFVFNIPQGQALTMNITYNSTANPDVSDSIYIAINNPVTTTIVGDPQFVGLRGQSYQVHGIDGAVYNIITEQSTQVNARFVFLTEGQCPIINGIPDNNCWSHPGSYLGEIGIQQIVDGKVHAALITAGNAKQGFAAITLDGKALKVGETKSYGTFKITYISTHRVSVSTTNYDIEFSNSDAFVNQALKAKTSLSKLSSHGLLGQTHTAKVYSTPTRYIEGSVDDYVIADNDIFGTEFVFNQFQQ
jgi:hypothetical protein